MSRQWFHDKEFECLNCGSTEIYWQDTATAKITDLRKRLARMKWLLRSMKNHGGGRAAAHYILTRDHSAKRGKGNHE